MIDAGVMRSHIYIYADRGTSIASVRGWQNVFLRMLKHPPWLVSLTYASTLEGDLHRQAARLTTLVMPGGADLPYKDKLDGYLTRVIQRVLKVGGCYIGSCAGAYFASKACIFEAQDKHLRVVGDRELRLVPYAAIGAVRPGFRYGKETGATMEVLSCNCESEGSFSARVYCNGGPGWVFEEDDKTKMIGQYSEGVLKRHGVMNDVVVGVLTYEYGIDGRIVLCGVHPELQEDGSAEVMDAEMMKTRDKGKYQLLRCITKAAIAS